MLLFRPQMVGGPSWLVITEKVSVRQRDAVVISFNNITSSLLKKKNKRGKVIKYSAEVAIKIGQFILTF